MPSESDDIKADSVGFDRRVKNESTRHSRRITDSDWTRWVNRTRDIFFLGIGLAGTINQLFYATPPNPVLYPILASLLGAPFALALDEKRRNDREKGTEG